MHDLLLESPWFQLKLGCSSEHAASVVHGVGFAADLAEMKKSSSAKSV